MKDYPDLQITWDWLSAPTVKAPELRATWANLEIRVGPELVTLVVDRESQSSRRSIFVSLYPLAEWIAFNWWFLQANTRPATALSRLPGGYDALWGGYGERYLQHHGIRGAGDGFLWPNLFLLPEGNTTKVVWNADPPFVGDRQIRFLSRGNLTLDTAKVSQHLADFVDAVIQRLNEEGVTETTLATEWTAIQQTDAEEAEFCLAAARLGLDPYSEAEKYGAEILAAARALDDTNLLRDFFDVVDPEKVAATLRWVSTAKNDIDSLASGSDPNVADLRATAQIEPDWDLLRPWEVGWRQARLIRKAANVDPSERFDVQRLVRTYTRQASSPGLQALGNVRDGAYPFLILSHRQHEAATAFTLARAIWHVLWQPSPIFLVTSAHTDRQKMERAFAAELLAPAEGIRARLVDDGVHSGLEEPALDELASHYGVSTLLVQHQVENQIVPTWQ